MPVSFYTHDYRHSLTLSFLSSAYVDFEYLSLEFFGFGPLSSP